MAPFRSTRCALGRVRRSVDAELPRSTPFRPVGQSTLDMMKINPSLMFSGACGNAFRRYASLFDGEIVLMLTYGESPAKSQVPEAGHERVWFARPGAGGVDIPGGDLASPETPGVFSWVMGVPTADEADRVFAGLADGGEVLMPLQATHWSPRYGVVRDPFGIRWEINCDAEPAA